MIDQQPSCQSIIGTFPDRDATKDKMEDKGEYESWTRPRDRADDPPFSPATRVKPRRARCCGRTARDNRAPDQPNTGRRPRNSRADGMR